MGNGDIVNRHCAALLLESCWSTLALPCFLSRDGVAYGELADWMDQAAGDGRPVMVKAWIVSMRGSSISVGVEVGMAGLWCPLEDVALCVDILEMVDDLRDATSFPSCDWTRVGVEYDSASGVLTAYATHGLLARSGVAPTGLAVTPDLFATPIEPRPPEAVAVPHLLQREAICTPLG